jgi:hypothetical protein
MRSLEDPAPRHELTTINVSDSKAAWGYLLSLLPPQMTGTVPWTERGAIFYWKWKVEI